MLENEKMSITIQLDGIKSENDLQIILMKKLEFPDFYGKNWDAFWDTITGLVEMPDELIFIGWDNFSSILPKDAEMLRKLLDKYNNDFPMWKCEITCK